MSWSLQRQLIILLLVTGFFALTAFILWFIYHPRPSCLDGIKNQDELDVDCGGACVKVCPAIEVSKPVVLWQKPLFLTGDRYGLAALVENKNNRFGITRLDYEFKVFAPGQVLLATVPGSTFMNPSESTIIYEPNIDLGQSVPNRVIFEIKDMAWVRVDQPTIIQLVKSQERFINHQPNPEARAVIRNDSVVAYNDVVVQVVLSDANRNVFAVSQTIIDVIEPGEAKDVFFHWPQPFNVATTTATIIDIYSRFNTLKRAPF